MPIAYHARSLVART